MSGIPTVSAILATHQRRGALPAFIDAIVADDGLHELIVVVDGSTDGSADYVRSRGDVDPRISCIEVDHVGQFGALHTGIEAATGEVVLLVDDDVIALCPLASGHGAHHAKADSLVVVGTMPVADLTGADRATKTIYATTYDKRCRWFEAHPDEVLEHLWGGNVSLRRADALRIGLEVDFDLPEVPGARFYQQDRAFGLRCRAGGLTGVYDAELRAEHHYTRDLDAHRRDIRGRAFSARVLHELFPATLGPLEDDPILGGGLGSQLLRRAGASPLYGPLGQALALFARAAGKVGLARAEMDIVRSFNALETGRGLLLVDDALAGHPPLPSQE